MFATVQQRPGKAPAWASRRPTRVSQYFAQPLQTNRSTGIRGQGGTAHPRVDNSGNFRQASAYDSTEGSNQPIFDVHGTSSTLEDRTLPTPERGHHDVGNIFFVQVANGPEHLRRQGGSADLSGGIRQVRLPRRAGRPKVAIPAWRNELFRSRTQRHLQPSALGMFMNSTNQDASMSTYMMTRDFNSLNADGPNGLSSPKHLQHGWQELEEFGGSTMATRAPLSNKSQSQATFTAARTRGWMSQRTPQILIRSLCAE